MRRISLLGWWATTLCALACSSNEAAPNDTGSLTDPSQGDGDVPGLTGSGGTSASTGGDTAGGGSNSTGGAGNGESGAGGTGGRNNVSCEVEATCGDPIGTRPFKGVANSPCSARQALGVSWYYNWTRGESEPCADGSGGAFVPMIWGHPGDEQNANAIRSFVDGFVSAGYPQVLGFNEPDNSTQANIAFATAIELLGAFENENIQVGSPATAANAVPGQAWFKSYMDSLNAEPAQQTDFLAIHWYGWNAGSCDADAAQLENYITWAESFAGDRPIWITEWGCLNQSAPDEQTVIDFYQGALKVFARHTRIERYAWYPWSTNCGLTGDSGGLTALGEVYAAAPAYR